MGKKMKAVRLCFSIALVAISTAAYATNGMNLEGYGPIATGMGGASMAYDNGTAAMMNNPATLALMGEGNRLDLALGFLGPDVKSFMPGQPESKSSGDSYFMPAVGWARKSGSIAYGLGVFSQGGMGAEYDASSFLALNSGDKVRSELGVGRVILPIAANLSPDFTVAGSLDYVWATLDLKMAVTGQQLVNLVTNCSGPACSGLGGFAGAPWTRIDFSGGGDYSGAAKGSGWAAKLGATYKVNQDFSIGAAYHSKTQLSDLETSGDGATISAAGFGAVGTGKIKVRDFQWPQTYAIGVAWNASKRLMIVADYKRIGWEAVMKNFKMTYEGPLAGAPGNTVDFALPQNWKDQNVYELGAGYMVSADFTLRLGVNLANNPIPAAYVNPLFPAIEKDHYTIGAGYMISKAASVDASYAYAPEVKVTNAQNVTITHSQSNAQVMFSYRF